MAGQKDVRRAAAAPGSLKIREWVFGAPSIGMCTSCLKEFHATLDCLGNVFAAQADLLSTSVTNLGKTWAKNPWVLGRSAWIKGS
jgi:hypothetical protein